MSESFVCPLCQCEFQVKKRLKHHLRKHGAAIRKQSDAHERQKKHVAEQQLIEKNLLKYGSMFANESQRNKYFDAQRLKNPLYTFLEPQVKWLGTLQAGAFGLGKSRKH